MLSEAIAYTGGFTATITIGNKMNKTEYFNEVNETASCIISDITDEINNQPFADTMDQGYRSEMTYDRLHETIDGHEYIIYTANHLPILQHSPNDQYMVDNIGDLNASINKGLDTLHGHLAFWAFYADVQEAINEQIEAIEQAS